MNNNNNNNNKVNVLDSVNNIFSAIEKANRSGAYSLEESAKIYTDVMVLRKFLQQLVDSKNKTSSKLEDINENEEMMNI